MQAFKKFALLVIGCLFFSSIFADSLDAKKIFQLDISQSQDKILLNWKIQPGYFLYQKRIKISNDSNPNWPTPVKHQDRLGQWHNVYRNHLQLSIPFQKNTTLKVTYQGCSDKGICFPPQTKTQKLIYNASHSFLWVLLSFFGLGALMAFTPCVLPMLPVMTKVVLGNEQHTKKQRFGLAISYVLGMSISYALVGAVLSQVGKNLFMIMQNPKIVIVMALIYTYFGLATLEWVKIRLPQNLQEKTLLFRSHLQSGHYGSAALMGSLSLLVLSPCVTAPLLGALTYITQLGQVWKGTLALFMLGLGMGFPLMVFAVSAGHFIPKAGVWMNNIKQILAILLFAVAALLIQRSFETTLAYFPWIVVFLIAAYLLRPQSQHTWSKGLRITLVALFLFEALWISYGIRHPKAMPWPFKVSQTKIHTHHHADIQKVIDNTPKPVILYFTAKWCATCQYLEKNVWPSQQLSPLFKANRLIKIDISNNTPAELKIMHQFDVIAPPTVIKLEKNPHEALRLSGEEITIEHLKQWEN